WRSPDGVQWEKALKMDTGRGYSAAMAVLNEVLYASMNEEVWRSFDGLQWAPVGEITPKTIEAMEVFKGDLYAGTTRAPGAQIYRTTGLTPAAIRTPEKDIPASGTLSGSYIDIQSGYYLHEVLQEVPKDGASVLEHKWAIPHPGGARLQLAVRGYHSPNAEGDDFVFSYSTDDKRYIDMFTLAAVKEDRSYQFFTLPPLPEGTLYIRVRDTDRTRGRSALDRLYLDHLYLLAEGKEKDEDVH
ncbi:MAG TPA: hypothetical protein VI382_01970, partial [Candidatus Manganitrophaceae bacterium]|nr:hypothetical protein [Candidatus Manganitrophaceae bacterium]